jgi:membrane protein DedA with SNARE-associated domain
MYVSLHISLWFVVFAAFLIAVVCYWLGRRAERREWMERLGRR